MLDKIRILVLQNPRVRLGYTELSFHYSASKVGKEITVNIRENASLTCSVFIGPFSIRLRLTKIGFKGFRGLIGG